MKARLCVDIDNVIARTDEVMRRVIREHTGGRVDLQYEDVVEFAYQKCADAKGEHISVQFSVYVHSKCGAMPILASFTVRDREPGGCL